MGETQSGAARGGVQEERFVFSHHDTMKQFINTRAQVARVSDNAPFNGWITEITGGEMKLSIKNAGSLNVGDSLNVLMESLSGDASVRATVAGRVGEEVTLSIPQMIRMESPKGSARILGKGMTGTMTIDGQENPVEVIDFSKSGMAISTAASVEPDQKVQLVLTTPEGELNCNGRVVYSMFDQTNSSGFRIGVEIEDMGRVDRAHWSRLLAA